MENLSKKVGFLKGLMEGMRFDGDGGAQGKLLSGIVELEVTNTEPGFKGDTAANTTKPATFETGLTLQVPLFIENGEVLKIDTRDGGEYLGRA